MREQQLVTVSVTAKEDDMDDTEIVSRIMDTAAEADRRALFAALQAAVQGLIDGVYGGDVTEQALARVERALDVGGPYGSPEHLASLDGS